MRESISDSRICFRLYAFTVTILSVGVAVFSAWEENFDTIIIPLSIIFFIATALGAIPAYIILRFTVYRIEWLETSLQEKFFRLILVILVISSLYGLAAACLFSSFSFDLWTDFIQTFGFATGALFASGCVATAINYRIINQYFSNKTHMQTPSSNQTENVMENNPVSSSSNDHSNKILIKGVVTALLILAMLIPMMFIQSLVTEREERQKEVVAEVSSKWATAQTVTTPYIVIPYTDTSSKTASNVIVLPENLSLTGNIIPEQRPRSIYKVLLYRSDINVQGNFIFHLPKGIEANRMNWNDAKICVGVTDFKGIEEKLRIKYNNNEADLAPGLPTNSIDSSGLSAPLVLSDNKLPESISFNMNLKLKGSEQLHFTPLSANSNFELASTSSNPSFDGNTLPAQRTVNGEGFKAKWSFNEANLPFNTIMKDAHIDKEAIAFGVSMVQPADQYAKTMRSVKYALLIIGLTFALFFITELMQKRPVHPVQYVLIGLALVIFYSLLLSISEFVLFDVTYIIAASATTILIALYTKSHFNSWKTSCVFAALLSALYGFIFILIRLEDTALLVGSIGLFIILALIMYASRKINWYHPTFQKTEIA